MLGIIEQTMDGMSVQQELLSLIGFSFPAVGGMVEPADKRRQFRTFKTIGEVSSVIRSIRKSLNHINRIAPVWYFQFIEDSTSSWNDGCLASACFIPKDDFLPTVLLDAVAEKLWSYPVCYRFHYQPRM